MPRSPSMPLVFAVLAVACAAEPGGGADDSTNTSSDPATTTGSDPTTATTTGGSASIGPASTSSDDADPTSAGADSSSGGDPLDPDPCIAAGTCPPGEWIDVTPTDLGGDLDFGPGPIVVDPGRPSDLYMAGGGDGVWRSTDYGNTWERINSEIGYVPMGLVIAVAPTTPATVWIAGYHVVYRSTDGGVTYEMLPNELDAEPYSFALDPNDDAHLVSGLHEADGIVESIDGGVTWQDVGTNGFPGGGKSWYVFFVEQDDAEATRGSWLAIAQDGGSVTRTLDGGATWTIPSGIDGLQHGHGNAQIAQVGDTIFVPGVGGPGDGIYRSTDRGASFTRVREGAYSVAWASDDRVYGMWGWACSDCDLGASFAVAPLPGDDWEAPPVPANLVIGANHMAVTSDGNHHVFVGTMWNAGVWRYVEP